MSVSVSGGSGSCHCERSDATSICVQQGISKPIVEGVILAAGLSTRAGQFKMTLPLDDRTVIEHTIAGMREVVERVIVVTGWQAACLQDLLADREGVDLVHNAGYRAGMFSSVKVGLAQVRASRFFLLPGDLPLIGRRVYERLLKAEGEIVIPTFEGRRGHPVCMSSPLIPEILAQADDSNLRAYIDQKGYVTVEVEDEGILLDLDMPEDYERLRARLAGWDEGSGEDVGFRAPRKAAKPPVSAQPT